MTLQQQASTVFADEFGYEPSHSFRAPGRVNIIGEHTDYNDGFVLPAAINFGTAVAANLRNDSTIRICAINFNHQIVEFSLGSNIQKSESAPWSNYARGVCQTLLNEGYALKGADLAIVGDVPYGAGLSSSAALEIVLIQTLLTLAGLKIDPTEAALLGQRTENEYIGAKTGIMDQLICARGEKNHALLIDCRDLTIQSVTLDPAYKIVIFNSNVKRGLVDSEYNTRREQCHKATTLLGVPALRDATMEMLISKQSSMDDLTFKRARHVITENERTIEASKSLERKDWASLGRLMAESHISMKQDFEITVPPIDGLVELISEKLPAGKGGARMTGGGFGGCVVSLVPEDKVDDVIEHVSTHYESRFGLKETVYICQSVDGAFMAQ